MAVTTMKSRVAPTAMPMIASTRGVGVGVPIGVVIPAGWTGEKL